MPSRFLTLLIVVCLASATISGQQRAPASDLKIVVIAGEGAVNIIQQRTAVAPIIEVRDRNNLPVAGASVTFSVGGSGATFGSSSALTVVTNAAGQATAAGLTPTAAGAVQINVTAAFQGQLATAAVTQTNFATAQAAAAAGAGGGGGGASGAGAGAGTAGGGGGLSMTTIAIVGGAVAGGAVVATQTDVFGGADGGIVIKGTVYATGVFGLTAATCPSGVFESFGGGSSTCYLNPVSGATVSTTLDGNTTTTDAAGNFDLETTLRWSDIDECKSYTLTISAAGNPTIAVPVSGFSGNDSGASSVNRQKFTMSPMSPEFMRGC